MVIDFKEAAFLVHQAFRELAVHEMNLSTSLQSLVPTNKEHPSKAAQYLYENSLMLKELSEQVKELIVTHSSVAPQLAQLLSLISEALRRDEQLRQTYQIGERFRFIRDRLQTVLEKIEQETSSKETKQSHRREIKLEDDELWVHVHLYNAQGMLFRTWQSMIMPKAFFDFSVNRPIYQERVHIEAFIRSKANKNQHAYLTVAVKRDRILPPPEEGLKDSLGNPVIKVKEGSLHYERTLSFVHNEQAYALSEEGELVKEANEASLAEHK